MNRIRWIDCFKGIVIILVVLGHATGLWNGYIYQFHVAAFFFISGYVSNLDKKQLSGVITNKFFTLFIPLTFFVIAGDLILFICSLFDWNVRLFGAPYIGFWNIIRFYIVSGYITVQFLGACWFLIFLLEIFLFEKIIIAICCNLKTKANYITYIVITTALYLTGYGLYDLGITPQFIWVRLDMLLITSSIFALGIILSRANLTFLRNTVISVVSIAINIALFYIFARYLHLSIDLGGAHVNKPLPDLIMQLNGMWFVYNLSTLMERWIPVICDFFSYIGKNTLGILAGHFGVFKIIFCVFAVCGIMTEDEIAGIVPPQHIGSRYWYVFVIVSLIVTLFGWEVMKRIPGIAVLVGTDRNIYKKCERKLKELFSRLDQFVKTASDYYAAHSWGLIVITLVVLGSCVHFIRLDFQYHRVDVVELGAGNPWKSSAIHFDSGWYEKDATEDYMWINDTASITIDKRVHTEVILSIYVPDTFTEVTSADIMMNGTVLGHIDFTSDRGCTADYDLSELGLGNEDYVLTIDFNGVHLPDSNTGEIRELSGMVSYLKIR